MDLQLEKKIFMVSASSSGLGYGIAKILLQEGATVAVTSRYQNRLEESLRSLSAFTTEGCLKGYILDVTKPESIENWTSSVVSDFGTVDGLVVNAGGPAVGDFDHLSDEHWNQAFNLTLMSAVRMIRCVLSVMRAKKSGNILTITSSSVKEPINNLLLSNVLRSGVAQLVKTLSHSVAKDNIRINNIIPGRIETERVNDLDSINAKKLQITQEEYRHTQFQSIPMGRYGNTDEFGRVAAFLLSSASSYIHGSNSIVDGGKIKSL